MEYVLTCLRNLRISDYDGAIELKNNDQSIFYLMFRDARMLNVTKSNGFEKVYGIDVCNTILQNFFTYAEFDDNLDPQYRDALVNNYYIFAETLSHALWFIKENAVTPYLTTVNSDYDVEAILLRRNSFFLNSEANSSFTDFSKEEVIKAMEWFNILEKLLFKTETENVDFSEEISNMSSYINFETPSFYRAYHFLNQARKADFLPARISSYISILETLFAVNGDNTFKVAQRTAALIGETDKDRIDLFKEVTGIYNIRSKYLHGSEIKKSTDLLNVGRNLEDIVRKVMSKIFKTYPELNYRLKKDKKNPQSMNHEDVNDWFNELVLFKG